MKYILTIALLSSNFAWAFSADCPSDDKMFVFRNGSVVDVTSGDMIAHDSTQVVDVLSVKTEPCVMVGTDVVDVEVKTLIIQANHSYMEVPHKTQFVCTIAELKEPKCGE